MPKLRDTTKENLNGREIVEIKTSLDGQGYITFSLPSKRGSITVRGMLGQEEDIFARDNRKDPVKPFFEVMEACTKEKLDFKRLLLDDFMTILYMIRRMTYGDFFTYRSQCKACGVELKLEEDLNDIKFLYASNEAAKVLTEKEPIFECTLPLSKHKVSYSPPVAFTQKLLQDVSTNDPNHVRTRQLQLCVLKVDDKPIFDTEWRKIHAFDLKYFEQQLEKLSVGPITTSTSTCPGCKSHFGVDLPIGSADFLLSPTETKLRDDGLLTTLWGSPQKKS